MGTAEQLASSLRNEGRGVHLLLWDDKEDLVHALLILTAATSDVAWQPILVPTVESELRLWSRQLCDQTSRIAISQSQAVAGTEPSSHFSWQAARVPACYMSSALGTMYHPQRSVGRPS